MTQPPRCNVMRNLGSTIYTCEKPRDDGHQMHGAYSYSWLVFGSWKSMTSSVPYEWPVNPWTTTE